VPSQPNGVFESVCLGPYFFNEDAYLGRGCQVFGVCQLDVPEAQGRCLDLAEEMNRTLPGSMLRRCASKIRCTPPPDPELRSCRPWQLPRTWPWNLPSPSSRKSSALETRMQDLQGAPVLVDAISRSLSRYDLDVARETKSVHAIFTGFLPAFLMSSTNSCG